MASLATYFITSLTVLYLASTSAQPLLDTRNSVTSLQLSSLPQQHPRARDAIRSDELHLLDTVLLASVDGRFHAINRTTGRLIWNMDAPLAIDNLVRTQHPGLRPGGITGTAVDVDVEGFDLPFETYIIEPQSGNIYLSPSDNKRDDPLQRLPFSMAQLVDMSPFQIDRRTFVGKKRTSLISLDLRSGEVLEILDPEQCSWGDQANPSRRWRPVMTREEELLDELDPPDRTVVHIGRTDYHVTVFSKDRVIQNLTYSAYGPNNVDKDIQYRWLRTPDNWYHQPTPDGHLLLFKTDDPPRPLKQICEFKQPIVAVFDAVTISDREDPLLLLQPTPSLQDLYPAQRKEVSELALNGDVTYVGRIGNSLYALNQENYPHVLFAPLHQSSAPASPVRGIEDGSSTPFSMGGVRDIDEYGDTMETCISLNCLTGTHLTESANPSRLSRLIGSAPIQPPPPPSIRKETRSESPLEIPVPDPSIGATSSSPPVTGATPHKSTIPMISMDTPKTGITFWTLGSPELRNPIWTGLIGLVLVAWMLAKRIRVHWSSGGGIGRDMGFEPVVLPPLRLEQKLADRPSEAGRVSFVDANVKPLPPVPRIELPAGEAAPVDDSPPSPEVDTRQTEDPQDADGDDGAPEGKANGNGKKGKKSVRRGTRGRGGGGKKVMIVDPLGSNPNGGDTPRVVFTHSPAQSSPIAPVAKHSSSLEVSDTVLGYGSHGTMVFQGTFQGRAVAVKRLLQDFVTLASREVTLLQESDDHPNVIRYYFKETRDNFLYIALELCPASLADIVERPHLHPEISATFDPKKALSQVTMGLRHLHSLKIVHRDIKPHNILVSKPSSGGMSNGQYRMLISDFGLCRKLESDQTSFLPTMHSGGGVAAGTVGWRAPEILKGDIRLDELTLDMSSGGTPNSSVGGTDPNDGGKASAYAQHRLTKAVDVFALGCLFYYTLAGAEHPYGERFEREVNIVKDVKKLDRLAPLGEDGTEAEDLISKMLSYDPKLRPDTTACLVHPYFWNAGRRLAFLQDASDRFEIMPRDPPDPQLIALEKNAREVVGPDWHKRLDKVFDENLGKFRKYGGTSVQDLMRALRNKKHHYQDLPDNVKRALGVLPEGYLAYFTRRFPRLFLHVYYVVFNDPLLRQDAMFRTYFQLTE